MLQIETRTIGGYEVAYTDQGTGPVLLLIHGLGADLSRWREIVGTLSKSHRVIAFDLLGFGRSAKPDISYRGQTYVDQVFALLDALEIEAVTLIGNSMGGWIALLAAEQKPDRIERLVLVAPAFVLGLPDSMSAETLATSAAPQSESAMRAYLGRVYASPPTDSATVRQYLHEHRMANANGAIEAISRSLAAGEDAFTPERLAQLRQPMLIIHGDTDGIVPIVASEDLVNLLPNAQLSQVLDAGHWPQVETPEAFLNAISEPYEAKAD
ncbi:alpha/beta fold hydrolase [Roseibium alexandrii]|uniref:alpha/beta fold hydrolase n=1 Tax=Roseibium alexandrii TaxID=388408 RepID=UPI00375154B1